jgi:hypothetical protein
MAERNTVTFLAPSYLLYANATGTGKAIAVFTTFSTHPPTTTGVPLGQNTFVEVGGGKFGGPTLTQINLTDPPDELIIPLFPQSSLTAGPKAYAILLGPFPSPDSPDVYELHVFFEGKDQIVKFANIVPDVEEFPPES